LLKHSDCKFSIHKTPESSGRLDQHAVVVQADKNVRFEVVYNVFDIARSSGATSITVPAIYKEELENR
jgi:biopolymer transport protein ExbD